MKRLVLASGKINIQPEAVADRSPPRQSGGRKHHDKQPRFGWRRTPCCRRTAPTLVREMPYYAAGSGMVMPCLNDSTSCSRSDELRRSVTFHARLAGAFGTLPG